MATTTPNYGWSVPESTDLVKDGATAIELLGDSIDSTTKDLNPSTTAGDIEYRTATANTNDRLAIGTAGQVLTVNSGATAPEWQTTAASGLTLIHTETLSAVASVNIDSKFTATYVNYLVLANIEASTANDTIIQLRAAGSTIATGYKTTYWYTQYTDNTWTVTSSTNDADIYAVSSNTDRRLYTMTIGDPQTSEFTKSQIWSTDNAFNVGWNSVYPQTTAIDGLRFSASTGTITGTVRIYGYQNS
jgi:hypothetical protein